MGATRRRNGKGLLTVEETPHLLDPASGYVFNVNDSPWTGAGESSLRKQDYPAYVETGRESARGLHAMRLLQGKKDFTLDSLMAAAYDSYLPWFIKPLSALTQGLGESAGEFGNQDGAGRSNCRAPGMGSALGRGFGGDFAGDLLGPGDRQGRRLERSPYSIQ